MIRFIAVMVASLVQVDDWATIFEVSKRLGVSGDARFRTIAWIALGYYYALVRPGRSAGRPGFATGLSKTSPAWPSPG
jgi:hypothetical protein